MQKVTYRLLSPQDYEMVKAVHLYKIFTDYGKNSSRGPEGSFDRMVFMRRVDLNYCGGAFMGDKMVGFVLMGKDVFGGKTTTYASGIGILPEYRGQGLASGMLQFLVTAFAQKGIEQAMVVTKPLTVKGTAGRVYERAGYVFQRELHSYKVPAVEAYKPYTQPAQFEIRQITQPNWAAYLPLEESLPAWERTKEVILKNEPHEVFLEAWTNNEFAGFLIGDPRYGKISRAGVKPALRHTSALPELLRHFYVLDALKRPRLIQIDPKEVYLINTLKQFGFEKVKEVEEFKLIL